MTFPSDVLILLASNHANQNFPFRQALVSVYCLAFLLWIASLMRLENFFLAKNVFVFLFNKTSTCLHFEPLFFRGIHFCRLS